MTPEEVVDLISKAFTPYKCEVELLDLKHRFSFHVLDKDNSCILHESNLIVSNMNSQADINNLVELCKAELRNKGFII